MSLFINMSQNSNRSTTFHFKQFSVSNSRSAMKIGTDGLLLGALTPIRKDCMSVLDIGTGTGVIALMIAQRAHAATIVGIEINSEAAAEAKDNFANSPFDTRLSVIHSDFLSQEFNNKWFDLIVSNPPYYTNTLHAAGEARDCARNQQSMPLQHLIAKASLLLSENGVLSLILPTEEINNSDFFATLNRLHCCKRINIFTRPGAPPKRVIAVYAKYQTKCEIIDFNLTDSDGEMSYDYHKALSDFLIKL